MKTGSFLCVDIKSVDINFISDYIHTARRYLYTDCIAGPDAL